MKYSRPFLWAFRLALPFWAVTMLVWSSPIFYGSQALLLVALLLAGLSPIGKSGRAVVAVGLVMLSARHLGWLPPTYPALQPISSGLNGPYSNQETAWMYAIGAARWFASLLNWLPLTVPVMALTFAASRLAHQLGEQQSFARTLRRLVFVPLGIYVGAVGGLVLALALGAMSRVPSGLIPAAASVLMLGPLVVLAWLWWLVRLSLSLRGLTAQVPHQPSWGPLLVGFPLAFLGLFSAPRLIRPLSSPSYGYSQDDYKNLVQCKVLKVEWARLDGRYALEVGRLTCSPGSGSLGISDAVRKELENHARSVKAGQIWLFYESDHKLQGEALTSARNREDDHDAWLARGQALGREKEYKVEPDSFAWVAQKQASEAMDLGRCLAWENSRHQQSGSNLKIWVLWPKQPTQEQLLRRCQMEVFRLRGVRSICLQVGTGPSPAQWKPAGAVLFSPLAKPNRKAHPDSNWSLAKCPVTPLTPLLLRQHAFFSSRPGPKKRIAPEYFQLCQKRRELLLQALMQYQRDHLRWPSSPWEVVPDYLTMFPTCPLDESREYNYTVDSQANSCRLDCTRNHDVPGQPGQGPFTDSRLGRGQSTHSTPTPAPELNECLKHPRGWLGQFEPALGMQP